MKRFLLLLPLLALLAAGCAHSRSADERSGGYYLPEVPFFLSGPMGVLLTNAGAFSAQLTATSGSSLPATEVLSGQLFNRENLLLFAPDVKALDKRLRGIGLSYIWDVKENRGYVLVEAMQGYAPIGFSVHYTNVQFAPALGRTERILGHPCSPTEARVASSEGATAVFQLAQATDLKQLPLRITGGPKAVAQSLSLSRVRPEAPPLDLFRPPESFTRYDNPDLLMSELTLRQHNLKRSSSEELNAPELSPGSTPSYQRPH
jgi:hypothetical protein